MATYEIRRNQWGYIYACWVETNDVFKLPTEVKVDQEYYDAGLIKSSHPEHEALNKKIKETFSRLVSLTEYCRSRDLETNANLLAYVNRNQFRTIRFDYIERYARWLESDYFSDAARQTLKNYRNNLYTLERFEQHIGHKLDIETFDLVIFQQLLAFLQVEARLSDSTIRRQVGMIKTFLMSQYPDPEKWSFVKYKPSEVLVLWLNHSEIERIKRTSIPDHLTRVRDAALMIIGSGLTLIELVSGKKPEFNNRHENFVSRQAEQLIENYGQFPVSPERFTRLFQELLAYCGIDRQINLNGIWQPLCTLADDQTCYNTYVMDALVRDVHVPSFYFQQRFHHYSAFYPYIRERNIYRKQLENMNLF